MEKGILVLLEFGMNENDIAKKLEVPLQRVQRIKREKLKFDKKQ